MRSYYNLGAQEDQECFCVHKTWHSEWNTQGPLDSMQGWDLHWLAIESLSIPSVIHYNSVEKSRDENRSEAEPKTEARSEANTEVAKRNQTKKWIEVETENRSGCISMNT